MTEPASYPCPLCRATATLGGPCPGCGRAPDPDAAAVLAYETQIAATTTRLEQARAAYETLADQLAQLRRDREVYASRVRVAVARERSAHQPTLLTLPPATSSLPPTTGGLPQAAPSVGRQPESSPRTVQNLLFVLGGLLLGIAAIVFTAVAWATFDVVGRALILGVLTVGVLAVPPLVRRRALTATAETFAALGLLLVVLDGYAIWYVNLGGVADHGNPGFYAGAVATFTALLGYGYARVVGTAATRFGALLAAQPALPLFFLESSADVAGWSLIFTAVALGDLVLFRLLAGPAAAPPSPVAVAGPARAEVPGRAGLRVLSLLAYLGMLGIGGLLSLVAWLLGADLDTAVTGSLALLAAAGVLAAGLWQIGATAGFARPEAGGVITAALAAALARPALVQWPHHWLLVMAGAAALVAALVLLLGGPLSARWPAVRLGMICGAALALSVPALCAAGWALGAAWQSIEDALPWWAAAPARFDGSYGWLLPVSLVLVAVTAWLLTGPPVPEPVRAYAAAGAVLLLPLTVPGHPALTPWAALACDLAGAAVALAVALLLRRHLVLWGVVAGLLAGHALLAGSGSPARSAWALGGVVLLGLAVAAIGWRSALVPDGGTRTAAGTGTVSSASALHGVRVLGGVSGAVALALMPPMVHSVVAAAGADDPWSRRAMLAAAVLTPLWVYLSPRRLRDYAVIGGLAGALWALPGGPMAQDSAAVYAALCTLALALVAMQARWARAEIPAQVVLALTLLLSAPALHLLFVAPLGWLGRIWAGDPVGTGLAPYPSDRLSWSYAVALLLLAPAVAAWFRRGGVRLMAVAGGVVAGVAGLAALAAAQAPWPTVSAVELVLGAGLLVLAALRRYGVLTLAGGLFGVLLTGAGLAGMLAEKWSTIAGLALLTVALAVVAVAGSARAMRTVGWMTGAAVKVLLVIAIGEAAELRFDVVAYLVLGVAAIVLGLAYAPFAREQRVAAEAAAHAAALVALSLCHGHVQSIALVLALWGVAVGLTVLASPRRERVARAAAAALAEALAWCAILAAQGVGLLEAYTLPVALLALAVGWYAARTRPELSSWLYAGPALVAALLPSLAGALTDEAPLRRLLLGLGALAVTVFGSVRRLQAPVVLGGGVLLVVALHELLLVSRLLPTWVPIAVGGAVLLALAITYERSRRDVARLRGAIGRMR
ncbi:SCO7613 C-terminal domain-containing membrane protein [Catellatospora methionotrophica]|uniref:SCO7613 C-terminal domain-containing membrane protein n=1 Tax=Catellatospora methionotrophica TaxID=121620 RepID=UPI00340AFE33